jgi:hypothetical protein
MGNHTTAIGNASTALGTNTEALGFASTAMGDGTRATFVTATAMGRATTASGTSSTAMGSNTTASGASSTAMGQQTEATHNAATAMGFLTDATRFASTAMGHFTTASGDWSTAMGSNTTASGTSSTAMGSNTTASGTSSTAMGSRASTNLQEGSFVYGDRSTTSTVTATRPNSFVVRAAGGTTFYSNATLTTGVSLAANGGAWASVSDRSKKENFRNENGEIVLGKIAAMPIQSWSYKAQDASIRHLGPTAQDFYAAFGLGESDTTITTTDIDGVNMLAVQALERRTRDLQEQLRAKDQEIEMLRREMGALLQRLERLEGAR